MNEKNKSKKGRTFLKIFATVAGSILVIAMINITPTLIDRSRYPKDSPEYYYKSRQLAVSSFINSYFSYREEGAFLPCIIDVADKNGEIARSQAEVAIKKRGRYRFTTRSSSSIMSSKHVSVCKVFYDNITGTYCAIIGFYDRNKSNDFYYEDSSGNMFSRLDGKDPKFSIFYHVYDKTPHGLDLYEKSEIDPSYERKIGAVKVERSKVRDY